MRTIDRRNFIKTSAVVAIGSTSMGGFITAAEAHEQNAALQVLSSAEASTLSRLGELLVTGAERAGLVHFLDYQLSVDPNDCLLTAKYFQVKPPYIDFYRAGIKGLDLACSKQYQKPFAELPTQLAQTVIKGLFKATLSHWQGPPAALFYQLVRSDAVDVVYGTPAGFAKLSIPYMAHIMPPESWSND